MTDQEIIAEVRESVFRFVDDITVERDGNMWTIHVNCSYQGSGIQLCNAILHAAAAGVRLSHLVGPLRQIGGSGGWHPYSGARYTTTWEVGQ